MTAVLDRPATATPPGGTAPPAAAPRQRSRPPLPRPVYRFRLAAVCLGLVALAFLQDPGRIAADTKLDLTQDPWSFLGRALHLWDPNGFFGQLQNQAYGYLFPMGPFFGIGTSLGLPGWVVQRLWWSLILVLAFLGVVRLARLIGVASPLARTVSGLAFALAPRMLTTIGPLSSEAWVMALAPWVLVPLVYGSTRGSPRRWAAVSGLVVLCLGAVNAVATVAVLPLGLLWIVTRESGPRRRSLFWWWGAAVALASLWWLLPLVLLGRYSPPFLDWIESANVTTLPTDPLSVLRGVSHWVAYVYDRGGPVWPAGWELVTSPATVTAGVVVAAAGLVGLARRDMPERRFLLLGLIAGWVLVSLGHVDVVSGVMAEPIRSLLDAALAPLRNVHKFDPVLRIPLVLGLGWAVQRLLTARPGPVTARRAGAVATVVALVAAVAVSALPALDGGLTRGRSYAALPDYWRETAFWLDNVATKGGRAFITPGASFGVYLWGRTQDEPLQALSDAPWGVRDAVPLSSAGNIRLADEIEARLASGQGSSGLASALDRAGIRYLVVRNDLDPARTGAPRQVLVHQALARSPGIERVAFFGGVLSPFQTQDVVFDDGLQQAYPPVEIFRVSVPWSSPDPRVALRDADRLVRFGGGPESLVAMADSGVLRDQPAILAGDPVPTDVIPADVQTDGNRRVEVNFGQSRDNRSATLGADDPYVLARRVHDYDVQPGGGTKAVARVVGATAVRASSSGSDVDAFRARRPSAQPWSALDGDPATAWVSGDYAPGVGQWWEVALDRPTRVTTMTVRFLAGGEVGAAARQITVSTDRGEATQAVRGSGDPEQVRIPGDGPVSRVRLTLTAVDGGGEGSAFGLREVTLPGVEVARPVSVAGSLTGPQAIVLSARTGERSGCVEVERRIVCSPSLPVAGEERAGIDRLVDVPEGGEYRIDLSLRPNPGIGVDRLLTGLPDSIQAVADSRLTSDPAVRARAAVDDDLRTAWIASPLNQRPTLTLQLPERRAVTGLRLQSSDDLVASRPLEVTVDAGAGPRRLFVDANGYLRFPAVVTDRISLQFGVVSEVRSLDPLTGGTRRLPVGVSEVAVLGADDLRRAVPEDFATGVPCGFGPVVNVDGADAGRTAVRTTTGALLAGREVRAEGCAGNTGLVRLTQGSHRIRVAATSEFLVDRVTLTRTDVSAAWRSVDSPTVLEWQPTQRRVRVESAQRPRILELAENFNAGWTATLAGTELTPLRVDGWRQAWVIPAGTSGEVTVSFAPDQRYRTGLVVGLAAILLLVGVALWRPRRAAPDPAMAARGHRLILASLVLAALLVTGVWGLLVGAAAYLLARRLSRRGDGAVGVLVAGFVCAAGITAAAVVWPASADQSPWITVLQALATTAAVVATGATAAATAPRAPAN